MFRSLIRLLLVEDNPIDRRIFSEYLKSVADLEIEYDYAETLSATFKKLSAKKYDIVVLDLGLPDSQGIDTFYELHKHSSDMPVIIMSGLGTEELTKKALANGAHDYLIKGEIDAAQLVKSIRFAILRQQYRSKINSPLKNITESSQQPLPTPAPKFISRRIDLKSTFSSKELLNEYEGLINCLLENNLKSDTKSIAMIQSFAQKADRLGLNPRQLESLAEQQQQLDPKNILLLMLNTDIIGELVVLLRRKQLNSEVNKL